MRWRSRPIPGSRTSASYAIISSSWKWIPRPPHLFLLPISLHVRSLSIGFGENFAKRVPDEDADKKVIFMAFITTAFLGFMRVQDVLALQVGDVKIEPFGAAMTITIRASKTDQFGKGEQCRVVKTGKPYCAVTWMTLYLTQLPAEPEQLVFDFSPQVAREKLRKWLRLIGMPEEEVLRYSTHSCRSGGATEAARVGIQDSVIQRHGRWKSTCFMKYTRMARTEAGEIITSKI